MKNAFSLIELILAIAVFLIIASGAVVVVLSGFNLNRNGIETVIANQYAAEGMEAVRSIRNQSYNLLVNTTGTGVARVSNVWAFSGSNNTFAKYTRVIAVSSVNRDTNGNIVATGGRLDPNTKKVTSIVTWNFSAAIPETVTLTEYFTNWKKFKNGFLVYGDGGTTTDAIKYKILDTKLGTWSSAQSTADIDPLTTNKALYAVRVYSSSSRDEKIAVSRHFDGTSQFIYAQVYNAITSSWGNVQLLSSWKDNTFLDVQNFDGTYLDNGDFMVVYSDNTNTPKSNIWDGTTWQAQTSLNSLGATGQRQAYIVTSARPRTNEVIGVFFTQAAATKTEYWNGSTWSTVITHATLAPSATEKYADFAWSQNNNLIGGLIFSNANNDKNMHIRIWTADGLGSGSWSTTADSTAQTDNLGALAIVGRPGANEFDACNKDHNTPISRMICYKSDFTPVWTNPTNQTLTTTTDSGIQRSYHLGFESVSGDPAINVYSDNTSVPKLKKYSPATTTWDASATSIFTTPFTLGIVKTVRVIPFPSFDDIMILVADANLDLYSMMWDGTNNIIYTTPAGFAFSQHGTSGSGISNYWYDFAWDNF